MGWQDELEQLGFGGAWNSAEQDVEVAPELALTQEVLPVGLEHLAIPDKLSETMDLHCIAVTRLLFSTVTVEWDELTLITSVVLKD